MGLDNDEEEDDVLFAGTNLMLEGVDLDGYGSDFGQGHGSMPALAAFERSLLTTKPAAKKSSK